MAKNPQTVFDHVGYPTVLLLRNNGEPVATSSLSKTKYVGFLISAEWYEPALYFVKVLKQVYNTINHDGTKVLEIILIPNDIDINSFMEHFGNMPWLGLPFSMKQWGDNFAKKHGITSIPELIITDGATGTIITTHGKGMIQSFGTSALPFTNDHIEKLRHDARIEVTKQYPLSVQSKHHNHPLVLKEIGLFDGIYFCDVCHERGFEWTFQCDACNYDVHLHHIKAEIETNNTSLV